MLTYLLIDLTILFPHLVYDASLGFNHKSGVALTGPSIRFDAMLTAYSFKHSMRPSGSDRAPHFDSWL
jgi:hypothetical protein